MSQADDERAARREMTGANSEHGGSRDGTERLDEAGRGAADAAERDQAAQDDPSLVDEAKETAEELWDTLKDTVVAVKEGYDEAGANDTGGSRPPD